MAIATSRSTFLVGNFEVSGIEITIAVDVVDFVDVDVILVWPVDVVLVEAEVTTEKPAVKTVGVVIFRAKFTEDASKPI